MLMSWEQGLRVGVSVNVLLSSIRWEPGGSSARDFFD